MVKILKILQILRKILYLRVVLPDRQDTKAVQLEIQLPWRQHCGNKKPISMLSGWMPQLLPHSNTWWHHSSLMRLVVLSLWLTHYFFSRQSFKQSLVQYDAVFPVYMTQWSLPSAVSFPLWVWCPSPDVIQFSTYAGPRVFYFNVFPSIISFYVGVCACVCVSLLFKSKSSLPNAQCAVWLFIPIWLYWWFI